MHKTHHLGLQGAVLCSVFNPIFMIFQIPKCATITKAKFSKYLKIQHNRTTGAVSILCLYLPVRHWSFESLGVQKPWPCLPNLFFSKGTLARKCGEQSNSLIYCNCRASFALRHESLPAAVPERLLKVDTSFMLQAFFRIQMKAV